MNVSIRRIGDEAGICLGFPIVWPLFRIAAQGLSFPMVGTLSFGPGTSDGIAFEVSVLVPVSLLQKHQQRIAESRVHANALAGMVAADTVACEALFEQSLFMGAATVEVVRGRHARRINPALAP